MAFFNGQQTAQAKKVYYSFDILLIMLYKLFLTFQSEDEIVVFWYLVVAMFSICCTRFRASSLKAVDKTLTRGRSNQAYC